MRSEETGAASEFAGRRDGCLLSSLSSAQFRAAEPQTLANSSVRDLVLPETPEICGAGCGGTGGRDAGGGSAGGGGAKPKWKRHR